jgi:diaminopimelate epimerase
VNFTKMHGLGNDFIVIPHLDRTLPDDRLPEIARKGCDRHFGIGADGILLVERSETADFRMRIYNPDGSEPQMCGNGIRCFAKYLYDRGLHSHPFVRVETEAGVLDLKLAISGGRAEQVRVDMGRPILERNRIPMSGGGSVPAIGETLRADGTEFRFTAVSMGNPHCVIFVDEVESFPVETAGPKIERHPLFPERINIEFAEIVGREKIKMRVWERGAGITLACGTGACATLVASALNGHTGRSATVQLPGGDLFIEWADDDHLFMTGPATEVFEGEADLLA